MIHAFIGAGDEPVLFLLSGGGSALLALPQEGLSLGDLRETTSLLLRAGASIHELNAVRKHLEMAKGGGMARAANGTPILALLVSDVIGDPLDVIASGPLTPDPTTFFDALEVLDRYRLRPRVPPSVRAYLEAGERGDRAESPKEGDPCFASIEIEIVGNLTAAARAAVRAAEEAGYRSRILTLELTGEARDVGRQMGQMGVSIRNGGVEDPPPICLISGGETTVTVLGMGMGGRNQEFALGAAIAIAEADGILVASMGTDGIDGPTDAAGALATGTTIARAREAGLDPDEALRDNDSYTFFRGLGDLLITGPTGTNVMDLQVLLVE
jgi:glycerate-2-kinase